MIKTTAVLREELKVYANPDAKIGQLVKTGILFPIVRGLYETDAGIPGYYIAPAIYGPSYLSFEFALAYHSLIPEGVYNFTSATFEKKKMKKYDTSFGIFLYRDVPSNVFFAGLDYRSEKGYGFLVASPEKAVCDQLYTISPLQNRRDLEDLLFIDMRIDIDDFFNLDLGKLLELTSLYNTQNHKLLQAYIKRRISI